MARRSDHSRDEIREMALDAAERIVREEGYAGLSARKVARPMGYTVGTLYLVFKNLDDLVLQVNARTLDELHEGARRAYESRTNPQARVMALGRSYIEFATTQRNRWSMIFEHQLPAGEEWPTWYSDKVARSFALVEEALQPLAPDRLRPEIKLAARALWGGVHGLCILALTNKLDLKSIESVQSLAESLITNYLIGFMS
ncbi:MAG: TetR/AcrR family transcriptional regulator, partial [Acidiferrobacterales bacterium]